MGALRSLRTWWVEREELAMRDVQPLEGTNMSLWNSQIPDWWSANVNNSQFPLGTAQIAQQVWVANRCQHLNAAQLAGMPLLFNGTGSEPMWVANPDPNLFPNGISDAIYAIVDQLYGWGWSVQYVTDFYADGFPRTWTVIPSASCEPRFDESGQRIYKIGDQFLDPRRVVQIDRNPTTAAHGTSAIRAYAQTAWGLLAAGNQSLNVNQGGIPQMYFHPLKRMTKEQAEDFQAQWMAATTRRNGAPPVIPVDIEAHVLSINPSDLALLDTQEWNSRVLATAYGVPALLLNMALTGSLAYQTPIQLMQAWWLTELRTTGKRIGDAFSAQMLPRGSWVSFDASDITAELSSGSSRDDEQAAQGQVPQVASASPSQSRTLTAIGGGG